MEEDFRGLNVDLEKLAERTESFFKKEGFQTKVDTTPEWYRVQAKKIGLTRKVVGASRCIEVNIKGNPNQFEVEMTTGEWGKNIAASAILGAVTLGMGWLAAGVSAVAYRKLEEKLFDYIQWQIDELRGSATEAVKPTPTNATVLPVINITSGLPHCPRCNKRVKPDYKFCMNCGFDLETLQTKCPSCSKPVEPSFNICPYCGVGLSFR